MERFKIQDSRFRNLILILILILITYFLLPTSTKAISPNELEEQIERVRREREVLLEEQRKLVLELEAVNKESQSLGSAVKSLETTKKKLNKDISITQSKITSTNLTIKSLENDMDEKKRQIDTHRTAIAHALITLSDYDTRPLVFNLLAAQDLSGIWRDQGQLDNLNDRLKEEIEALRLARQVLNRQKMEKEKMKEEQLGLKLELSGQKLVVEESQKAKTKLLTETKNKEAVYQKMLQENLTRQKEFEEDLFRLESELMFTLDPSLIPTSRPGILSWPLDKIFITQRFGRTIASSRLYTSGTHNGVDFRASQGTPVKAMLSGIVAGTGNTDEQKGCGSYGRWVLIKHANGLSSVYAHLSATIVSTGESVKTSQTIGYSGGTPGVNGSGYSTGPHLHVGLFASQGVEIRQFITSRNCKKVIVPVADLRAYLDPLAYLPSL